MDSWLEEQSNKVKRTCVICDEYGPGTPEGSAFAQFLALPPDRRHGTTFTTFVKGYLHKRLHARGAVTTWRDHAVRCLGHGGEF